MDNNNKDINNNAGNISEVICNRIAQLRKREKLSQEALAGMLGITFQAVSKWENNVSCPDISIIPDIAKIFNVSVGYLFGEDDFSGNTSADRPENLNNNENNTFDGRNVLECDWKNDDIIRVVVARGHKLIKSQELDEKIKNYVAVQLCTNIDGGVIESQLNINFSDGACVSRSTLTAGANINCGDISDTETMTAGCSINCGDITDGGNMSAGSSINCGDISDAGNVSAGNSINCGDISEAGNVSAGTNMDCGDISESGVVSAGNTLQCSDIADCERVEAHTSINCSDINDCDTVSANDKIICGDINDCGDIHFGKNN